MSRRRVVSLALVPVAFVLVAGALPLAAPPPAAASVVGAYIPPVSPPLAVITDHFRPPPDALRGGQPRDRLRHGPRLAGAWRRRPAASSSPGRWPARCTSPSPMPTGCAPATRSWPASLVAVGERRRPGPADRASPAPSSTSGSATPPATTSTPRRCSPVDLGAHLVPGPDEGADPIGSGVDGERRSLAAVVAGAVGPIRPGLPGDGATRRSRSSRRCRPTGWPASSTQLRAVAAIVHAGPVRVPPTPLPPTDRRPRRRARLDRPQRGRSTASTPAALGYAPSDVLRFSYAGGRVPGRSGRTGPGSALDATPYGPADTETDLRVTAARLAQLVEQVAQVAPGVPIDVMAHSQGGVVARLAIERLAADGRACQPRPRRHHRHPAPGGRRGHRARRRSPTPRPARCWPTGGGRAGRRPRSRTAPSLAQLSETSPIVAELGRPVPAGIHLLSIGASGDLTVPWVRTPTPGATTVLVAPGRVRAPTTPCPATAGHHPGDRPGPGRAARRPASAWSPSACADVVTSHLVAQAEDALGLADGAGRRPVTGRYARRAVGSRSPGVRRLTDRPGIPGRPSSGLPSLTSSPPGSLHGRPHGALGPGFAEPLGRSTPWHQS